MSAINAIEQRRNGRWTNELCPFGRRTFSASFGPIQAASHAPGPECKWSHRQTCKFGHKNLPQIAGQSNSIRIFVFRLNRSLKCARITLHMNLFASFAANNSLWLVWYLLVMPNSELLHQSPVSVHTWRMRNGESTSASDFHIPYSVRTLRCAALPCT